MSVVVIGLGNEFRRDDGLGPLAVRALAPVLPAGTGLGTAADVVDLIAAWAGARLAIVVDLVRAVPPRPGRLHRLEVGTGMLGKGVLGSEAPDVAALGGHHVDLAAGLALSRVLGTLPPRVVIHGAEGADVRAGTGLTAGVRRALPRLVRAVTAEVLSETVRRRAPG